MRVAAFLGFGVGCIVFFDEVEKTIHPTRMGSVREPGSLTHPQVPPIELGSPKKWYNIVSTSMNRSLTERVLSRYDD